MLRYIEFAIRFFEEYDFIPATTSTAWDKTTISNGYGDSWDKVATA
jgi:hypothetical protein